MTSLSPPEQSIEALIKELTPVEQEELQSGQVVISGEEGQYIARILVNAPPSLTWDVLTDYEHFEEFLPSVAAAEVLASDQNRTVVEQTNCIKVLLADVESTIKTENVEIGHHQIEFKMLEGDLEKFRGNWKIAPVSDGSEQNAQTMIQQSMVVEADLGLLDGAFYSMFKTTLEETLTAIRAEIMKRQQA
ncbi:MAG: SRPBCC family protein [Thermosynechococcaceae cyanobacterium]